MPYVLQVRQIKAVVRKVLAPPVLLSWAEIWDGRRHYGRVPRAFLRNTIAINLAISILNSHHPKQPITNNGFLAISATILHTMQWPGAIQDGT